MSASVGTGKEGGNAWSGLGEKAKWTYILLILSLCETAYTKRPFTKYSDCDSSTSQMPGEERGNQCLFKGCFLRVFCQTSAGLPELGVVSVCCLVLGGSLPLARSVFLDPT